MTIERGSQVTEAVTDEDIDMGHLHHTGSGQR